MLKLAMILGVALVSLPTVLPSAAEAAVRKKTQKTAEVYAATESEEEIPQGPSTLRQVPPRSQAQSLPELPAPPTPPAAPPPVAKAPTLLSTAEKFDPVPDEQKDPLVTRLRLVEALIQKHNRAYDYRIHTVRELQGILNGLEQAAERRVSARATNRAALLPRPNARKEGGTAVTDLSRLPEPVELDAVSPEEALEIAEQN